MKRLILPLLGMALLLGSLGWMLGLRLQVKQDLQQCQTVAGQMAELLPERTDGITGSDRGMPVLEIHGTDYAALLELPGFGLALPVSDGWNGGQGIPSRFSGSAYGKDLVIGGLEEDGIFRFCGQVDLGDRIMVTDMTGAVFYYTVVRVDRAKEAPKDWLEGWDLTLFCHAGYAMEYIAVRCELEYQ